MDGRLSFGQRKGVIEAGGKRNESHVFGWNGARKPSGHAGADRAWVRQTTNLGWGSQANAIQGLTDNSIGGGGSWTTRPARTPAGPAPPTPAYHPLTGRPAAHYGSNRHGAVAPFDRYVRPPASGGLAVGGSYQDGPPPPRRGPPVANEDLPRRTITGHMADKAVAAGTALPKLTPDQGWAHWKVGTSYAFQPSSRDYGVQQNILQTGWFA
eukprot:SAG22_NODE_206_length_15281_cov_6.078975_6_plen_211_part_00